MTPGKTTRRGRHFLTLGLLATVGAWPSAARAGGFTVTGIGGRRMASLANIAQPDDLTALFHNPAGLADQQGVRVQFSGTVAFVESSFSLKALDPALYPAVNPPGCGSAGSPACPWPIGRDGSYTRAIQPTNTVGAVPYLGISSDLGFLGGIGHDIVISGAAYLPGFYGGSGPVNAPTAYSIISGQFLVATATLGAGYRVNKFFAIGASVSYNYMRLSTLRKVSLVATLSPAGGPPSALGTQAQNAVGDLSMDFSGAGNGVGGGLGMLVTPTKWLQFGFNLAVSTNAHFSGPVSITAANPVALEGALELTNYKLPTGLNIGMGIPPSLQWGVSVMPARWIEISSDLRTWYYQLYQSENITPVYNASQPGNQPFTQASLSSNRLYNISYEVALGVLVRPIKSAPEIEFMTGMSYDRTPTPDSTFSLDDPSLSSINYAAGIRWAPNPRWRGTLSYTQYSYVTRHITTSQTTPPTNGTFSGVDRLPGIEVEFIPGAGS